MTIWEFVRKLKKIYYVNEIYYAYKDTVKLHFVLPNRSVTLFYCGEIIRKSTFEDMLKRIEDNLKFYEEDK